MRTIFKLLNILLILSITTTVKSQEEFNLDFSIPYGNNKKVGKYFKSNDTKIYYEEYGKGEPLFLIHGNGQSIIHMGNQIEYFKNKYRVIVADNRAHGKSELKTDSLTYEQMAKDWNNLARHLELDSINIVGWSDGAIISLIMGMNGESKTKKIVAMAANLRPDSTAIKSYAPQLIRKWKTFVVEKQAKGDTSKNWNKFIQQYNLLLNQPNISHSDLKKINTPVLVIAGDKDLVKNNHTVEIFENLPNAQLFIIPGGTHATPAADPALFNQVIGKFLDEDFQRPDTKNLFKEN